MKRFLGFVLSLALLLPGAVPAAARPPVVCGQLSPDCGGGGSEDPPPAPPPPPPSNPPPSTPPPGGGGGGSPPPNPCTAPPDDTRPHGFLSPMSDDNPGDSPPIVCVNGAKITATTQRANSGVLVALNPTLLLRLGAKQLANDGTYIWVASPTHLLAFHQEGTIWDGEWVHGSEYSRRGEYLPINALVTFLGGRVQHDGNRVLITIRATATETAADSCRIHGYPQAARECPDGRFLIGSVYPAFSYKTVMDHIRDGIMNPNLISAMNSVALKSGKYAPNEYWGSVVDNHILTLFAFQGGEWLIKASIQTADPALFYELEQMSEEQAVRIRLATAAQDLAKELNRQRFAPGTILPENGPNPSKNGWYYRVYTMPKKAAEYQAAQTGNFVREVPGFGGKKWVAQEFYYNGRWFDNYRTRGAGLPSDFEEMKAEGYKDFVERALEGEFINFYKPEKEVVAQIQGQLQAIGGNGNGNLVHYYGSEEYAVAVQSYLASHHPDLLQRVFIQIRP